MMEASLALRSRLRVSESAADNISPTDASPCRGVDSYPGDFSVEEFLNSGEIEKQCVSAGVSAEGREGGSLCRLYDAFGSVNSVEHDDDAFVHSIADLNIPEHDVEEFAWVSHAMDDTLDERPPPPVVLSSVPVPSRRKQMNRSRPSRAYTYPLFEPRLLMPLGSSTGVVSLTARVCLRNEINRFRSGAEQKHSRRDRRGGLRRASMATGEGTWSCTHCGVMKTPQMREGPHGANTLCNACRVRYRAGGLLPEYRPACSPTFVPGVHSNKRRKVLQMNQKNQSDHHAD